ncbi:MAG: hypothetical protein OXT72_08960 [Gammaproteobacteria bacterium]|nr:hypothetical protein [Gammaproteobacteria bacterium]MDE0247559.1 hypothetical protein [Gammaproteobacteria bacterium]
MHILVTDLLACPRCGPEFGLILRADELLDRRVIEGCLACANCRTQYPVRRGFSDLRFPASGPGFLEPLDAENAREALRLGALLGEGAGARPVALVGEVAGQAGLLSGWLEGIELLALHADLSEAVEREGISRLGVGAGRLPLLSGSLGGVAVKGPAEVSFIRELARVLSPGSRLVCLEPGDGAGAEMEAAGLALGTMSADGVVGVRK